MLFFNANSLNNHIFPEGTAGYWASEDAVFCAGDTYIVGISFRDGMVVDTDAANPVLACSVNLDDTPFILYKPSGSIEYNTYFLINRGTRYLLPCSLGYKSLYDAVRACNGDDSKRIAVIATGSLHVEQLDAFHIVLTKEYSLFATYVYYLDESGKFVL